MRRLDIDLRELKGIGKVRGADLAQVGLQTIEDLLRYAPIRYEDRTRCGSFSALIEGQPVLIRARVLKSRFFRAWRRGMTILQIEVQDGSGSAQLVFYNQPYLAKSFVPESEFFIYGAPKMPAKPGALAVFYQPDYERIEAGEENAIHMGRLVPVYRRAGGCSGRMIRTLIHRILEEGVDWPDEILPVHLLGGAGLMPRSRALVALHFYELDRESGDPAGPSAGTLRDRALHRLKFEEMFHFQLGLLERKAQLLHSPKSRTVDSAIAIDELSARYLDFPLTRAQRRVLDEIFHELALPRPMWRLLQGDVGSGKTVIALLASLAVMSAGGQVALMTPTEVLAEQHYGSFRRWLDPSGFRVVCLTGNLAAAERKNIAAGLESGEIHMAIGTHALIQRSTRFKELSLAIIDEQHRFGVWQRLQLAAKGPQPDILAMTATPIPRSLTLTLYGDLDVSLLDELPPGRQPVRTSLLGESRRRLAYDAMRTEIRKGRQVYFVCPVIEASDRPAIRDVQRAYEGLRREIFPDLTVGMLHGRLPADEKLQVLASFSAGQLDLLVCTTVIEVGVDVPNATLMVIQNADRFGLAQLHQLRGRVGRGEHPGRCLLITADDAAPEVLERMRLICGTHDGFQIAELDLARRGPGEMGGLRQSGLPEFRFIDLIRDRPLIEAVRRESRVFFQRAELERDENSERILAHARKMWGTDPDLLQAG